MKSFRRCTYEILQRIFGFDVWHTTPIQEREYARHIVRKLDSYLVNCPRGGYIIEVGCGLGDIVANINFLSGNKIGYDISPEVVRAAKIVHPRCRFRTGSFADIAGHKIAILIAINFLHAMNSSKLKTILHEIIEHNEVDMIVVDQVQSPPYQYAHDYESMMNNEGYILTYKSRSFEA